VAAIKNIIGLLSLLVCAHMSYAQKVKAPFGVGERMEYKVHYGFVNAAEAVMRIEPSLAKKQNKDCYHIVIEGKSIGMFDLFMRIRDVWGTYLDKDLLVPRKFYQSIEEGRYRKKETVNFAVPKKQATVNRYDNKKKKWKSPKVFDVPKGTQDLVSGYYHLRTLNYDKYSRGDTIVTKIFFDEEIFDLKIRYLGKESVKTKLGKYQAIVFSPIMPKNDLFDGKDSIKIWLSDDGDKIPLKVKAKMFVGAVEIDIKKYRRGEK